MSGIKTFGGLSSADRPFRNYIINGDMSVAQRASSQASITTAANLYYTVDRWAVDSNAMGTWTMTASSDAPSGQGFRGSLQMQVTTADASPSASDYMSIVQHIEGQNLNGLRFGGGAETNDITISFWARSTTVGTYIAELVMYDVLAAARYISSSYTINTANTWEKKIITIPGNTSAAIRNTADIGLTLRFWLGAGSTFTSGTLNTTSWGALTQNTRAVGQTNLAAAINNNIYITGIQLERGKKPTEYEYLPYYENLRRCQRYYQKSSFRWQGNATASGYRYAAYLSETMRDTPVATLNLSSSSGVSSVAVDNPHVNGYHISFTGTSGDNRFVIANPTFVSEL